MFYAHFVLAKKGPLAKIWLAAHWDKKLTKAHVFETNIEKSVDGILKPKVKMALRTSGHLLLGVVRIYSRKAKYLLQDCNEAFVKIKMAFRPGMVDLPEEHREAAMNAITLPEVFHDFDTAMPELNEVDIEAQFSLNQSRAEEITMREDYGSLNLVTHDDGFGDMGFDTDNPDIMREAIGNGGGLEQSNLLFADGSSLELGGKEAGPSAPRDEPRLEPAPAHMDDGFGGNIADVPDFGHAGGLFEGDLFGDVTAGSSSTGAAAGIPGTSAQPQSLQAEIEAAGEGGAGEGEPGAVDAHDSDDDMADHYDAGNSPHHSWGGSPPHDPGTPRHMDTDEADLMPPPAAPRPPSVRPMDLDGPEAAVDEPEKAATPAPALDTTTLLNNDEESFALAPVDATVLKGITKTKRKRKLIVDEVKNISGEEMKNQLSNTSDILTTLDLAPPTRRLMHWKESGGVEKLFSLPSKPIPSKILFKRYERNMTKRSEQEEVEAAGARSPDPEPVRRAGRKRRHEELIQPPTPGQSSDLEPPTPVPQEYEPSVVSEHVSEPQSPQVSRQDDEAPQTPGGMLSSLGPPLTPGPLTPGTLLQGGLTPGGLQHGSMTPGGLQHGGRTPAGLQHGYMTPAGLQHGDGQPMDLGLAAGGMTPAGLHHGGMTPGGMTPGLGLDSGMTPGGLVHGGLTPAGLHHGGMTPGGLDHGGMTPAGLQHGGMTPAGLQHGGLTPAGLQHGGMTPAGLQHGGMTPVGLQHGGMTPSGLQHGALLQHSMEQLPMMPQVGGEQAALLRPAPAPSAQPHHHEPPHTLPMEPLPLHGLDDHTDYQTGMQMTNLGYDDQQGHHSPPHDYDLPLSVENGEEGSREAGETEEQFSERVLNRRAAQLFAVMRPRLAAGDALTFIDLAPPHNNRKQVAQKFYSLLVLKKHQVLKLDQRETYGPILISKGEQFETEAI
ncbi:PREDICTED: double-strand-break repair protein rad21 homolog isoform X1 [Papilio xuthus]|uniref:Double-strand-break repair protein rad21 homolog isoform X1 n=1 Tax=Papilio xuthus TaxID=66420 RepID=A0AAJ6YYP1_PAPXU|nr:PREDICTED: double-strand-break repair protein rad21 homolog isoform X1 [Papilio xuthus]XP_013161646.1 PREDICTED: double-strand-break repair protein rad21 homolog isoform X1 [Papilio xuthus]XP_013161647.1 PREDICTED: double-strand-break repair protein rad21 homolog isoform X1 [Papilio xuthus]